LPYEGDPNRFFYLLMAVLLVSCTHSPPLISAVQRGNVTAVRQQLKEGADIEVRDPLSGGTALIDATLLDNVHVRHEMMKMLISSGANVNAQDTFGRSSLCMAANLLDPEAIKMLLDHGAKVDLANEDGDTPLIYACGVSNSRGALGVVSLLLANGANVNATTTSGRTPLILAAYAGNTKVVKMLLERGADYTVRSRRGETALTAARKNRHTEVAQILLNAGEKD
jgi:ankyrin repeat protein